ncbi:MAG: diguanylate cyclase [Rhodocyclaceae bacterium]|nr:diguanylate cyclase [Rhodocyclaceae bacterium]
MICFFLHKRENAQETRRAAPGVSWPLEGWTPQRGVVGVDSFPWAFLGLFGVLHGSYEWLELAALNLGDSPILSTVRLALLATSFLALFEFGRRSVRFGGRPGRLASPWLYALLLPIAVAGWLAGFPDGMNATVRYALGLTGAWGASAALFLRARASVAPERGWLNSVGLSLALYGIACGVVVPAAAFAPASVINSQAFLDWTGVPIQLIRGLLACLMACSLWGFAQQILVAGTRQAPARMTRHFHVSVMILLIVLALGWKLTDRVGNIVQENLQRQVVDHLDVLSAILKDDLDSLSKAARAMASEHCILEMLEHPSDQNCRKANETASLFALAADASIAYLMDRDGTVVTASNRDTPASLMGKNYRFRPYFAEALAGGTSRYFALGVTTGERGVYAGHPVRGPRGEALGVAVIKKNLDAFEHYLHGPNQHSFLIDPNGIAFLSCHPEKRMRSLWPLPDATREQLSRSRQFGAIDFNPWMRQEPKDGAWMTLEGSNYLVGRKSVGDGWSFLVMRTDPALVMVRLFGMIITGMLSLMALVYYAVIQREFGSQASLLEQHHALEKLSAALEIQATTDSLTGTFNRARFSAMLAAEMERARRYGAPFGIVMVDIDHFKQINDTHGHLAGDEVLVSLSGLVGGNVRATDRLARWGGEEFMILAPNSTIGGAVDLAEKTRLAIENHDFGAAGRVTCSFGVAQYRPDDTEESITGRADDALYRAKSLGRNRVERETGAS